MEIKTFGVVGAGQMGSGIAQVAAASGLNVIMHDIKDEFVERGMAAIDRFLSKSVERGKLAAEDRAATLGRIKTTTDLNGMAAADFVVEAASENEGIKAQIFQTLDSVCRPDAILSTNTSSIPIGRIASKTGRPEKVIGMHFMNPVPLMKLVEVIRGIATSDETFKITWDLSEKFGKVPALVNDYPGFISNRVLLPMINEAIFALYHGVADKEAIDTVMKLGMNHPMGPLALADLIGLDTCLAIMDTLYDGLRTPSTGPVRCCANMWKPAGWAGKPKKGFTITRRIISTVFSPSSPCPLKGQGDGDLTHTEGGGHGNEKGSSTPAGGKKDQGSPNPEKDDPRPGGQRNRLQHRLSQASGKRQTDSAVGTLLQISRALQIDSGFLLKAQEANRKARVRAYAKRTDNYAYDTLTPGAENKHLKAFRVNIEGHTEHKGVGYQHEGEEFVYVLSGKVEISVGDHVNSLGPSDTLHFNSGIQHHMRNVGSANAELLVVIYQPFRMARSCR